MTLPFEGKLAFRPALAISLAWDAAGVVLYLDGERVAEAAARPRLAADSLARL